MLMTQLRWLDFVADPAALTAKLVESLQVWWFRSAQCLAYYWCSLSSGTGGVCVHVCMQVCPTHIQTELISFVPEIIDDSQHAVRCCALVPITHTLSLPRSPMPLPLPLPLATATSLSCLPSKT